MPSKPKTVAQEPPDLGLERLVFFSDAVMAIAITLLTLDLKLPELGESETSAQVWQALVALTPRLLSFLTSFIVIGVYWNSRHRYCGYHRAALIPALHPAGLGGLRRHHYRRVDGSCPNHCHSALRATAGEQIGTHQITIRSQR